MMGSTATGFDVCQDRINYSCTRAKHGPLQAAKPLPLPLVNQPQTLFASVAEPSGNASRLIAVVQLDDGFSLMLGVATPKVAR